MTSSHALVANALSPLPVAPVRPRPITQSPAPARGAISVPIPRTQAELAELRTLLESNLLALHALLEEHRRTLAAATRAADAVRADLRADLRAITDARAPWVHAVAETRALLYVALRELIVANE